MRVRERIEQVDRHTSFGMNYKNQLKNSNIIKYTKGGSVNVKLSIPLNFL